MAGGKGLGGERFSSWILQSKSSSKLMTEEPYLHARKIDSGYKSVWNLTSPRRNTTQKLSLIDACHLRAAGTLPLTRSKNRAIIVTAAAGRIYFSNWLNGHPRFPEGDICIFKFQSCQHGRQNRPLSRHKNKRGYTAGNKVVVNKIQVTIFPQSSASSPGTRSAADGLTIGTS